MSSLQSVKALRRQVNVGFIMRQYNNGIGHPAICLSTLAIGKHSWPKTEAGEKIAE